MLHPYRLLPVGIALCVGAVLAVALIVLHATGSSVRAVGPTPPSTTISGAAQAILPAVGQPQR